MPRTKKIKETPVRYSTRQTTPKQLRPRRRRVKNHHAQPIGQHIVADPRICHGKPTFRGTRIMVWQVMEMLAENLSWDEIIAECHNRISRDAIAEAIRLSGQAFVKHAGEFSSEPVTP